MTDDALAVRLLAIFIDELDEQVQQLNDDLLALERTPGDAERLRAVFRVMHTLKGASRAAGLPMVEQLCHALEGELARVRDGGAPLGAAQIAMLFESADALGETRDKLRAGEPAPDATLATALSHARGRGSAAPLVRNPVVPNDAFVVPSEERDLLVPVVPLEERDVLLVEMPKDEGDLFVADTPTDGRDRLVVFAPSAPRESSPVAASHVRVSLQQVDAIAGAAAELAGLASVLSERADELAAIRARRRAERRGHGGDDALDRDLTRLLRHAGEDARAVTGVSGRLGASARHLRQRPLAELTEALPRIARDVAKEVGKQVRVVVTGGEIEADRVVLEALREPLLHLVRNAVDHGLELATQRIAASKDAEGEVRIEGSLRGDRLQVVVADDGRGLDLMAVRRGIERRGRAAPSDPHVLMRAIFDDGFTTRDTATTLSGRGVGMGIVRAAVERMGGTVAISSLPNQGTRVTIDVPLSIATMSVVLVEVGGVTLGVPSAFVVRVARADPRKLARVDGRTVLVSHERPTPVTTLAALLGPPFEDAPTPAMLQLLVLESGGRRLAVVVDDLVDERELVLRPLEHAGHAATSATVGTALLGTGVVALVLSVPALIDQSDGSATSHAMFGGAGDEPRAPSRILVVDDSITSRTLEQSVLSAAGYDVTTAVDGAEAWRIIERHEFALVVSDVEMPVLDGFGLCARIRANERTATLPVILVTSLDEPAHRARGLEAGADAYITKSSFDQDTLLETVRMLIGRGS